MDAAAYKLGPKCLRSEVSGKRFQNRLIAKHDIDAPLFLCNPVVLHYFT